jgi:ferredoxin
MVTQHVPHLAHTIFCICGPAGMIADVERMLRDAGVPDGQVRSERFETTAAATVLNAAASPASRPAEAADAGATRAAQGGTAHAVTFAVTGRQVTANPSVTLLEAAEANGIAISSSCRSGVCQSCRTRVLDGDADCRSDVLDPDDRAAGFILPCVSYATRDCVLEA